MHEKIGNFSFEIQSMYGLKFNDLKLNFPHVPDWILKEIAKKYGKKKKNV